MTASVSPLFVSSFGSGHPVLCLHGVEAHGLRWVGVAERLPGYRLVAPDLRGHGRSPKVGPFTAQQHLADLLPLLDALGPGALLVGHSLGGYLAWRLAGLRPNAISGLVLVDPAIALSVQVVAECTSFENSIVGHHWPDVAAAFTELAAAHPDSGIWAAALDAATATERRADGDVWPVVTPAAVREAYSFLHEPFVPTTFFGPTLLIEAGRERGRFVSSAVLAGLRRQLGGRLEHLVMDASHTIVSDKPAELAAAVGEFTGRLPR